MQIVLTPQAEKILKEKMASGLYKTAEEVVEEALLQMHAEEDESDDPAYLEYLKTEVAIGFEAAERGEFSPKTLDEIEAQVLARHQENRQLQGKRTLSEQDLLERGCQLPLKQGFQDDLMTISSGQANIAADHDSVILEAFKAKS